MQGLRSQDCSRRDSDGVIGLSSVGALPFWATSNLGPQGHLRYSTPRLTLFEHSSH